MHPSFDEHIAPPSVVRALLPAGQCLSISELHRRLEQLDVELLERHCGCDCDGARWSMALRFEEREIVLRMDPTERHPDLELYRDLGILSEEDFAKAESSEFSVSAVLMLGDKPLWDYHTQLRFLAALVPNAAAVYDQNAVAYRPASWLLDVASCEVPPAPTCLYSVHCVGDEGRVWMHTHGLRRCGAIELELLDIPEDSVELFAPLMEAVASMFIEAGPTEALERFCPGKGIELAWMPWKKALSKLKVAGPGGEKDRDEDHQGESGVLVHGRSWRRWCKPLHYVKQLENNPMLYISSMETERMTQLARIRFSYFESLLRQFEGREGWRFLVKLGYAIDGSEDSREHLWFEVHGYSDGRIDATLLNQPYHIDDMLAGDRGHHDVELLSDWAIFMPDGRCCPNSVRNVAKSVLH